MILVPFRKLVYCEAAILCLVMTGTLAAVPYASGVRNTSGTVRMSGGSHTVSV